MPSSLRLFGIRHHGPGSAASLVAALDTFRPDIVLLECPADSGAALATLANPELVPPMTLLLYKPKQLGQASFLPFAEFSPEWQAVRWCQRAGVLSPAWYELLFTQPRATVVTQWIVRAARLLRGQELDASSAHASEAVRLADTLAAVRGLALPGITEMQVTAVALLGGGYAEGLAVVEQELVVGKKLGAVPPGQPATPLQQDLAQQQKTLRLKPVLDRQPLALDLRQETHLLRSHLLHRLRLLDIKWGKPRAVAGGKAGTFHEEWELAWPPDLLGTWLGGLVEATFRETVPLLRRAFLEFSPPERLQLLDLAAAGPAAPTAAVEELDFDWARGAGAAGAAYTAGRARAA